MTPARARRSPVASSSRRFGWWRGLGIVGLGVTSVVVGSAATPASGAEGAGTAHAVGVTTETFVDTGRPTAANDDCKKIPSRTLPTTILYPATGDPSADALAGAAPDPSGAPYPLIVFAHGYSASPQVYEPLLRHWAAAGYVVAAPQFPLSSSASRCGAVAGDSVHQPEDMSFVLSSVLGEAARGRGPLAGLVDRHRVGAAGHSNGAITTYGMIANTALRDRRVRAAAVLAGTLQRYPKGRYDFSKAPPMLLVHGTDDALVPYEASLSAFNRALGPKGLLTVTGGDHGSAAGLSTPGAEAPVFRATTDFFDAYLRGDASAQARLPQDGAPGVAEMQFVADVGSTTTIPTLAAPKLHLEASVTPRKHLVDGQTVTVTWSGYTPGKVVNILQCNGADRDLTDSSACDFTHAELLQPDPTGAGSTELQVITGKVGNGVCDAKHPGCFIVVNNASSTNPKDSVVITISFADDDSAKPA